MLYPDEDEESVGREPETREPKVSESPRSTSSSPKVISAIDDDSAEVVGSCEGDIPKENVVEHTVVFCSRYGESSELAYATSVIFAPLDFFLRTSGVRSDAPTK